jgi:type II secretory pathway pseudopilin PulG
MLVGMAVTAVWMAAVLPSWRHQVIREKEAELIFRGEAIARAIYLYRQKNGTALPPTLDVLVSQKYLRKKYKDPITDKDFLPVGGATQVGGPAGRGGLQGGVAQQPATQPGRGQAAAPGQTQFLQGGIIGVRSTSQEESIRIYNNQTTYSQWAFDFTLEQLRAGAGTALPGPATGRGGRQGGGRDELQPLTPGGLMQPGGVRGGGPGGRPGGPGGFQPAPQTPPTPGRRGQ